MRERERESWKMETFWNPLGPLFSKTFERDNVKEGERVLRL